jgi:hypothetical protein
VRQLRSTPLSAGRSRCELQPHSNRRGICRGTSERAYPQVSRAIRRYSDIGTVLRSMKKARTFILVPEQTRGGAAGCSRAAHSPRR